MTNSSILKASIFIFFFSIFINACAGNGSIDVHLQAPSAPNNGNTVPGAKPPVTTAPTGQPSAPLGPTLASLSITGNTDTSITLAKPMVTNPGSPGLTVKAFVGLKSQILLSGSTVTNAIQGPMDVSSSGAIFSGLSSGNQYRIIVVAQNLNGYAAQAFDLDVASILNKWFCYGYYGGYPTNKTYGSNVDIVGTTFMMNNSTSSTYDIISTDYTNKFFILRSRSSGYYSKVNWDNLNLSGIYMTDPALNYNTLTEALNSANRPANYECLAKPTSGNLYTYCSGTTILETIPFLNQLRNGTGTTRDCSTGIVTRRTPFLNDLQTDTQTDYCADGISLYHTTPYFLGKREGISTSYDCTTGKRNGDSNYYNDKLNGYSNVYCPNGITKRWQYTYNMGTLVDINGWSWTCP